MSQYVIEDRVSRWSRLLVGFAIAYGAMTAPVVRAQAIEPQPRLRDLPPEERRQIMRERMQSLPAAEQDRIRQQRREAREANGGQPLSPEQRQQLRRDIRDHGRDVYKPHQGLPAGPRQAPHSGPRRP